MQTSAEGYDWVINSCSQTGWSGVAALKPMQIKQIIGKNEKKKKHSGGADKSSSVFSSSRIHTVTLLYSSSCPADTVHTVQVPGDVITQKAQWVTDVLPRMFYLNRPQCIQCKPNPGAVQEMMVMKKMSGRVGDGGEQWHWGLMVRHWI